MLLKLFVKRYSSRKAVLGFIKVMESITQKAYMLLSSNPFSEVSKQEAEEKFLVINNRNSQVDEDIDWFFDEPMVSAPTQKTNEKSQSSKQPDDFELLLRTCHIDAESDFTPCSQKDPQFLPHFIHCFIYTSSIHLWHSDPFTALTETRHKFADIAGTFLHHDKNQETLVQSLHEGLQCKYFKGLPLHHSLVAVDTMMISHYSEDIQLLYGKRLSEQLSKNTAGSFHYINVHQQQSIRPSVSCSRILFLSYDHEISDYFLSPSQSTSAKSMDYRSYFHAKESYFHKLQKILIDSGLDTIICFDCVYLQRSFHQQLLSLCNSCDILLITITNLQDWKKMQQLFTTTIGNHTNKNDDSSMNEYLHRNKNLNLLSLQENNIFSLAKKNKYLASNYSISLFLFTPFVDSMLSRGENEYCSRRGAFEVGEYHPQINPSMQFQFDETNEELLLYGNDDYNCVLFLQIHPNNSHHSTRDGSQEQRVVSLFLTSATTSYLQYCFYTFFRAMHKLRHLLQSAGKDAVLGSGLPELYQSVLIREEVTMIREELSSSSSSSSSSSDDEENDEVEEWNEPSISDGSETEVLMGMLTEYADGLEEYCVSVMRNGGEEDSGVLGSVVQRSKLSIEQFHRLHQQCSHEGHEGHQWQELLLPAIVFSPDHGEHVHSSLGSVYDSKKVRLAAFGAAVKLALGLLDLK
jgi:hypothetical protein